jgi:kojibiose phosphorylase
VTTDTWLLTEDRHVPDVAGWKEAIFTIANGYLSTRGTFEERRAGELRCTFINGLFVEPPGEIELLGAVPDWTGLSLTVDGEPFDLDRRPPAGYRRTLDLRSGLLTRTVLWRGAETGTVKLTFSRLLSMARPNLAALHLTVEALTDTVTLDVETGLDATVGSPATPVWTPAGVEQPSPTLLTAGYRSVDGRHTLEVAMRMDGLGDAKAITEPDHPRLRATVTVPAGERLELTKYVAYRPDRGPIHPMDLPPEGSFSSVVGSSRTAWSERWRGSGVTIDGDAEAELALHFAAFQLIGAAPPTDTGAGIGARLMSGFGYRHHVFWDTDIFITPYFTLTQPDLSRTHLAYRFRGLDGARRKAARFGRKGAFWAWESAATGDDVTPEWSKPVFGPPVRIWTGQLQEHITADVAWAADHYWRWTGDDRFMADEGLAITLEGARYWVSRVEEGSGGLHIRDVIGPDEYHIHVDDNFYTNAMAAWQLRRAVELAHWAASADGAPRLEELGFTAGEVAGFAALADRIHLHSRRDGVWEQHDGFFGLAEIDLAAWEPRVRAIYDLLGEERLQHTAVIKQADVVMAMALIPEHARTAVTGAANWDYYAPKTDHGSSLSLALHARVAARLGRTEEAYELFGRAVAIDLADSMGNGRDGIHAATQGGLLLAAIEGFAGLGLGEDGPTTDPRLPEPWRSIGFTVQHRGTTHEMEVTR